MLKITVRDMGAVAGLDKIAALVSSGAESALSAAGKKGLTEAQNRVPVRTGFLKNSLYSETKDNGIVLGGRADYTAAVEFGTYRMPARPFLRPGAEIAFKALQEELNKLLRL